MSTRIKDQENKWGRAVVAAKLSAIAYKSEKAAVADCKKLGFPWAKLISKDGAEVLVAKDRNDLWFAFRGTEPSQPSDLIADAKSWKSKSKVAGKVHDGFYDEIEKIWDKIEEFANNNPNKQMTITGHSLGAAMATLCAARLQDKFEDLALYTYGSPRVGNKEFISSCKFKHYRWVETSV